MPRWPDIFALGALSGEAQSVLDDPGCQFFTTRQPRQDRQASRIRRSPTGRTQGIRAQIKNSPGTGLPGSVSALAGIPSFIKQAVIFIHDQ